MQTKNLVFIQPSLSRRFVHVGSFSSAKECLEYVRAALEERGWPAVRVRWTTGLECIYVSGDIPADLKHAGFDV